MQPAPPANTDAVHTVPARLSLGGNSAPAVATVVERTPRWRAIGAIQRLALWWILLPIVVWIPPHFPWVVLVLVLGAAQAYRRYHEYRSLVALHGTCPKCGTEQDFTVSGPLRGHEKVTCEHCRWELRLEVGSDAEPG
jgi:hypothetical protein